MQMLLSVFSNGGEVALEVHQADRIAARDAALLYHASRAAIEGAFRFGVDFPVGAVVAVGGFVVGQYYASDNRTGLDSAHAEFMAAASARADRINPPSDTVAVTLEPCTKCQDFLLTQSGIRRIIYGLPREAASARGLVKPHSETIEERFQRLGINHVSITRVLDPALVRIGETLLDSSRRNPTEGTTRIDQKFLSKALEELNRS